MSKPNAITRARVALQVFRQGLPWSQWGNKRQIEQVQTKNRLPFMWPEFRIGTPQWKMVDVSAYIEEGFNINSLIYACIMYKFKQAASVRLRAATGSQDNPEFLPEEHPLSQLLERPAPQLSQTEFTGLNLIYLNIAGYSPVYMKRPIVTRR